MFLLIAWKLPCWGSEADNFNTSHVSINRMDDRLIRIETEDFNTSHVSINRRSKSSKSSRGYISIHLMFLLICFTRWVQSRLRYFNTSHVSINQVSPNETSKSLSHFNTSHVSINPGRTIAANCIKLFQYISCFY